VVKVPWAALRAPLVQMQGGARPGDLRQAIPAPCWRDRNLDDGQDRMGSWLPEAMSRDRSLRAQARIGELEDEQMRRALKILFAANGCGERADALTEEVLQRAAETAGDTDRAETAEEGEPLPDVRAVARGVLRTIREEQERSPQAREKSPWDMRQMLIPQSKTVEVDEAPSREAMGRCLAECLDSITGTHRALILEYYRPDEAGGKPGREALAEELGISRDALRLWVFKARRELQACLKRCQDQTRAGRGGTNRISQAEIS
jgi:DNA-directed RNA polymerase specialized sigma24 family protein